MTAVLDTNVLVRHLRGTPVAQARRATALLESGEELVLTSPVVAEVVFVLESNYEQARDAVAVAALSLLAVPSIVAPEAGVLVDALRLYQTARLHFVDAYVAAVARHSGVARVASFDKRIDRVTDIERVEP
jgi:predicted nucleic acid-binding protein